MACTWILALTILCGISNAYSYFTNVRPPYYPPPRYESCRESIEDLKALVEITQCLKPEPCVCPVCTSTLSEEVIIKLVNALIYTVTHTCGYNGKGAGGMPGGGNNGGANNGCGNAGGGNYGGGNVGGGYNGGANAGGGTNGGGNSGGGTTGGGNNGSGNGGGNNGSGNGGGNTGGKNPLLDVGVLNGDDTVSVKVDGKKIVAADVGPQPHHTEDGAIQANLLEGNGNLASVGLLGTKILNIGLGDQGNGGSETKASTPTGSGGGNSGGGTTGRGNNGSGNGGGNTGSGYGGGNTGGKNPLLDVGVLNGDDTLNVKLDGKKIVAADVGPQPHHTEDGVIQANLLEGNGSLASVGLLGNKILNIGLGDPGNGGSGTKSSTPSGSSNNPTSTQPITNNNNQPTTSKQPSNSSETNNSATGNTTGVAGNQSVLPGNAGNVGIVNNTMVNQGAASSSNLIKNLTTTTT